MVSTEEYLYTTDRALDGMVRIVTELGDDLANRRPSLPGANSPYALLAHCLGVVSYWAGALVAGRVVERDRDAEFASSGPVHGLLERVASVRAQFAADVRGASFGDPVRGTPDASYQGPDRVVTQGAALLHVYEELAQHHGQMEILRDLIRKECPPPLTADPSRLRRGHGVKWGSLPADALGAWVADMDLGVAPQIRRALLDVVEREDFGYPFWRGADPVPAAFESWMARRHGWTPSGGHTRVFTDLLQILQVTIEHTTAPGDGVAIHVPAYLPFLAGIARAGRRIVPLPMVHDGQRWTFALDDGRLRGAGCSSSSTRTTPPAGSSRPSNSPVSPRPRNDSTWSSSPTRSTPTSSTRRTSTFRSRRWLPGVPSPRPRRRRHSTWRACAARWLTSAHRKSGRHWTRRRWTSSARPAP